jgi:hypothetical protein
VAEQSDGAQQSWLEAENERWAAVRKQQQRRRDFLWLGFALLLLLIGNLTGFPGRFFT